MGRVLVQQPGTNTTKASTEILPKNVIIVDEDLHQLRLHDGTTPGGHVIGSSGSGNSGNALLSFMWSDHQLNHPSWLRADTFSWQSGEVYHTVYEHLVDDFNSARGEDIGGVVSGTPNGSDTIGDITISYYLAKDGHKVCMPDQESKLIALYEATGVAWYYILDTANQRFKLPRTKWGFTGLRDTVGDYVAPGLPNITGYIAPNSNVSYGGAFYQDGNESSNGYGSNVRSHARIRFDASRSSSIYGNSDTVQPSATEMYLYFFVGSFTQTAIEQTAGLNAELFNQKMDNGTPLARDIFSPDEWIGGAAENILSAGVGSNTITFTKNWQEYDYLWFSSVSDGSNTLDDSPHWINVKWMLEQAKAGVTNLAVIRYASGAYWYVNPQSWTETTMPVGSSGEVLYINRVYAIKLKNITAQNVGLLNYKGLFETAAALVATVPTAMGQWAIVSNDETQNNLQTKYFSTKDVNGNFVWAFGGVIDSSLVGADYVVESQMPTADNGYTWYRKYKSGWVEQGGIATTNRSNATPITLPVEMADTNYIPFIQGRTALDGYSNATWQVMPVNTATSTQTSTLFYAQASITGYDLRFSWQVSGMAAV